jgi:hypothetical protein
MSSIRVILLFYASLLSLFARVHTGESLSLSEAAHALESIFQRQGTCDEGSIVDALNYQDSNCKAFLELYESLYLSQLDLETASDELLAKLFNCRMVYCTDFGGPAVLTRTISNESIQQNDGLQTTFIVSNTGSWDPYDCPIQSLKAVQQHPERSNFTLDSFEVALRADPDCLQERLDQTLTVMELFSGHTRLPKNYLQHEALALEQLLPSCPEGSIQETLQTTNQTFLCSAFNALREALASKSNNVSKAFLSLCRELLHCFRHDCHADLTGGWEMVVEAQHHDFSLSNGMYLIENEQAQRDAYACPKQSVQLLSASKTEYFRIAERSDPSCIKDLLNRTRVVCQLYYDSSHYDSARQPEDTQDNEQDDPQDDLHDDISLVTAALYVGLAVLFAGMIVLVIVLVPCDTVFAAEAEPLDRDKNLWDYLENEEESPSKPDHERPDRRLTDYNPATGRLHTPLW